MSRLEEGDALPSKSRLEERVPYRLGWARGRVYPIFYVWIIRKGCPTILSINQLINQSINKTYIAPISSADQAQRRTNPQRDHVS